MSRPSCRTCPYWMYVGVDGDDDTSGECRFGPPRFIVSQTGGGGMEADGVWPWTRIGDFCGHHPEFAEWIKSEACREQIAHVLRAIERDRTASDSPTGPTDHPT